MIQLEVLVEEASAEEAMRHLLPKLLQGRARPKVINLGSKYKLLIMVLIDCDDDDCVQLKAKLEHMSVAAGLSTKSHPDGGDRFRVVNRVVIKELESWFIGDPVALRKAFTKLPAINATKGIFRNPDNGGSWEALHRFLKKHGIYKNSYPKIDAARRIAPHMDIAKNRSVSFQHFVGGIEAIFA